LRVSVSLSREKRKKEEGELVPLKLQCNTQGLLRLRLVFLVKNDGEMTNRKSHKEIKQIKNYPRQKKKKKK